MRDPGWKVSSTYATALVASLRHFGDFDAVRAELRDEPRRFIDEPGVQRWWPGSEICALLSTWETLRGRPAVIDGNIWAAHSRQGPLIKPLASVLLAFAREPAAALMSRLPTFLEAGVKGVTGSFTPLKDGGGGHVIFTFPEVVPGAVSPVWHGMFDFGFSLAKQGRIVSERLEPSAHHYDLAW
ncbi:MAG: hypothetical protein ACO1OB_05735 [Archangium sp.]